ncbi:MAG TPA: PAS domain S-box protein, partial [Thermoplasmatales archaeon]|nr:PAS domain S-box protein [Thermoplasmatales archaeon]
MGYRSTYQGGNKKNMEWDPVNALSDGILIIDKDLKVQNFNDGILRITGFSPAELRKRDLSDILKLPFPIEELK